MDRSNKELNRYKLFVSIQSNSKKRIKLDEIMKLPWDNETDIKTELPNDAEFEKIRQRAKMLESKIEQCSGFERVDMGTALS